MFVLSIFLSGYIEKKRVFLQRHIMQRIFMYRVLLHRFFMNKLFLFNELLLWVFLLRAFLLRLFLLKVFLDKVILFKLFKHRVLLLSVILLRVILPRLFLHRVFLDRVFLHKVLLFSVFLPSIFLHKMFLFKSFHHRLFLHRVLLHKVFLNRVLLFRAFPIHERISYTLFILDGKSNILNNVTSPLKWWKAKIPNYLHGCPHSSWFWSNAPEAWCPCFYLCNSGLFLNPSKENFEGNTRSTHFLFTLLVMLGNFEPPCIVTIKMVLRNMPKYFTSDKTTRGRVWWQI